MLADITLVRIDISTSKPKEKLAGIIISLVLGPISQLFNVVKSWEIRPGRRLHNNYMIEHQVS